MTKCFTQNTLTSNFARNGLYTAPAMQQETTAMLAALWGCTLTQWCLAKC